MRGEGYNVSPQSDKIMKDIRPTRSAAVMPVTLEAGQPKNYESEAFTLFDNWLLQTVAARMTQK